MATISRMDTFCLLTFHFLLFPSLLHAEVGLTSAGVLQRSFSARAIGLGDSFVSVDGGIDSLGYNPAGLADLKRPEIQTTYTEGLFGDQFGFTGYSQPLPFGVLSAGYVYYNAGTIDLNLSNGTQGNVTAEEDMAGLLSYSVPLGAGVSVGAVGKYFHLDLAQQADAESYAADAGALWQTPLPGFNLGAAYQNMGPDVKFEQEGDPLPATARLGASYQLNMAMFGLSSESNIIDHILFTVDGVKVKDQDTYAGAGVEIVSEHVDLRMGYVINNPPQSLTFGVGIKEKGFRFDYSLGINNGFSDVNNFSLGYQF